MSTSNSGSTPRLDRPLAQQVGAEAVNRADVRLLEVGERRVEAPALRAALAGPLRARFELRAQPQLQLAGRLLGERHRDDLVDVARPAASTFTMRATSSVVLPVPAAASTTSVSSSERRPDR